MKLNDLIIFTVGAAIGSVVTWKLVKTKYEQIAQEEIDSIKEYYSDKHDTEEIVEEQNIEDEDEEEDFTTMKDIISKSGYAIESDEKKPKDDMTPYVIFPEEYGEKDYDTVSLTYWANGILTDDGGYVYSSEEIEEMIGIDSLDHIGEFEDDSVHVRNDVTETDYEILQYDSEWEG